MPHCIFYILSIFMLFTELYRFVGALGIGVCYPRNGDDLPNPKDVVALCNSHYIERIYIYDAKHDALDALKNSGIEVLLGVPKDIIKTLAYSSEFARQWVIENVLRYTPYVKFRCIALGDAFTIFDNSLNQYLLPAMIAIKQALNSTNLSIPVSFTIHYSAIPTSQIPPSEAYFNCEGLPSLLPILKFLQDNKYPILYPVYTYLVYYSDPIYEDKHMTFPMLEPKPIVVQDGEFGYSNILDIRVDAVYTALEKVGAPDVEVIVSETGWPSSEGMDTATVSFAELYNNNLIKRTRANTGTPKRSDRPLETYIFSLFSQDKAMGKYYYGLFYPNMTWVYPLHYKPGPPS